MSRLRSTYGDSYREAVAAVRQEAAGGSEPESITAPLAALRPPVLSTQLIAVGPSGLVQQKGEPAELLRGALQESERWRAGAGVPQPPPAQLPQPRRGGSAGAPVLQPQLSGLATGRLSFRKAPQEPRAAAGGGALSASELEEKRPAARQSSRRRLVHSNLSAGRGRGAVPPEGTQ